MANETNSLEELRKPFPKEVIGKLPKGGIQLDYVGHAAVTDRLLQVDPEWHWEPLGVDEHGLPMLDKAGNLWIHLTVLGVTRIGVGDGRNAKECIGDALRNAAMRFGVALDLWSKEELESTLEDPSLKNEKPTSAPAKEATQWDAHEVMKEATPDPAPARTTMTPKQSSRIYALGHQLEYNEEMMKALEEKVQQIKTKQEADQAIEALEAKLERGIAS